MFGAHSFLELPLIRPQGLWVRHIHPPPMLISGLLRVLVPVGAKADFAALRNFVLAGDGSRLGVLLFPEICTMQLHLLTTGSPDLEVLSHVFHSLLGAVQANQRNAALLYNQVRLTGRHQYSFVFSKCALNLTD